MNGIELNSERNGALENFVELEPSLEGQGVAIRPNASPVKCVTKTVDGRVRKHTSAAVYLDVLLSQSLEEVSYSLVVLLFSFAAHNNVILISNNARYAAYGIIDERLLETPTGQMT